MEPVSGVQLMISEWSLSTVPALRVSEILRTEGFRDQEGWESGN